MTAVTAQENIDLYGSADLAWSAVLEQLEAGRAEHYWLATVDPDGRPHLNGVGARWADGRLYFKSGARTRKSKNLDGDRRCVIAAQLPELDVTFTGEAELVTDATTVQRIADLYAATGWPARARGIQLEADYSAPTAGPPPWDLWTMAPESAVGLGASGAMRWHFG
jgi:hypothetical protein